MIPWPPVGPWTSAATSCSSATRWARCRSSRTALALARAADDRWGEIDILQKIGFSHLYADRYDDAERVLRRGARVSAFAGTTRSSWRGTGTPGSGSSTDEVDDVAAGASDAITAADASGDLTTIAWAHTYAALALLRRGSVQPARELIAGRADRPSRARRLDAPALHARPGRVEHRPLGR